MLNPQLDELSSRRNIELSLRVRVESKVEVLDTKG